MEAIEIARTFDLKGEIVSCEQNHTGNINRTFVVTTTEELYIMQHVNTSVFTEPYVLMHNIQSVTNWISTKVKMLGGDPNRESLQLIKTKNGDILQKVGDTYWRMYNYIKDAYTLDVIGDSKLFGNIGKGLGHFHKLLDGYPLEKEMSDFHNTPQRYVGFIADIKNDVMGRVKNVPGVAYDIIQIMLQSDSFSRITELVKEGAIPCRVTHNDTKVNNFMLDKKNDEVICVVDLDTVMSSSTLFDFGDAARSGCNLAGEDADASNVSFNLDFFESFTRNYLTEALCFLNSYEINNLAMACKIITYELAMRFLNDYINGDTYFACSYLGHNLVRARNQLALAKDIDRKLPLMQMTITRLVNEITRK